MTPRGDLVADIIDNTRRIFKVVHEQSKRAERETGLTGPQLWAIKTIAESAPIMVSEIALRMHLHPATVVGILDRLEAKKLAIRIRSTHDRRAVRVELTERGKALVKKAPEVAQGLLVAGLEELPLQKLKTISTGLELMVGILGAQELPPQLILSPEFNQPAGESGMSRRKTDLDRRKRKGAGGTSSSAPLT